MTNVRKFVPVWSKPLLRQVRDTFYDISYRGTGRYCPVCEKSSRKFGEFGLNRRQDAVCMRCGSKERHRFTWLYLQRKTDLFDGRDKTMLHIAPEPAFEKRFKAELGANYLTADLLDPAAMVKMDITDIQYPDESFDVIYCSHVLEHVPDDKKALSEFYRVLKSSGWAIIMVPITADETFEDPSITDPAERIRLFGQADHIRRYGPDYLDRLEGAGFKVELTAPDDFISQDEQKRMGIAQISEKIYCCHK